jgi:hypothetical protein
MFMFRTKPEKDIKKAEELQLKRCKTTTSYHPTMGVVKATEDFTWRDKECLAATEALSTLQQQLKLKS